MREATGIISKWQQRYLLPDPDKSFHKGCLGRVGIISGSSEYVGAAVFACRAAIKLGADLVYLFCLKDAAVPLKTLMPEVIVRAADSWVDHIDNLPWDLIDAWLMGCGMGREGHKGAEAWVRMMKECDSRGKPLILDGDALYWLGSEENYLERSLKTGRFIVTPNLNEMIRLLKNRQNWTKLENLVWLKKGEEDIVDILPYIDDENSSPMAMAVKIQNAGLKRCGGIGDILAGALLAMAGAIASAPRRSLQGVVGEDCQELHIMAAVSAALIVKGACARAEDEAKRITAHGVRGLTANDILASLTEAIDDITVD